jgi:hypothetical protein
MIRPQALGVGGLGLALSTVPLVVDYDRERTEGRSHTVEVIA